MAVLVKYRYCKPISKYTYTLGNGMDSTISIHSVNSRTDCFFLSFVYEYSKRHQTQNLKPLNATRNILVSHTGCAEG